MVDAVGGELELDHPPRGVLPARPALRRGAGVGELGAHRRPEGDRRVLLEGTAEQHGDRERLRHDVLALGEDGTLEPLDVFDARVQQRRDLARGEAGANVRLNLSGTRTGDAVVVVLAPTARTARLSAQHLV